MFVTHFVSNKRMEKTTSELMSIKQGETKILRDYIGCFKYEVITIPRLQQEVAVITLMTGLREGTAFRSYLGRKKLTNPTEVLGKAAAATQPEEDGKEKDKDRYRTDKKSDNSRRKEDINLVKKGHEGRSDRYCN